MTKKMAGSSLSRASFEPTACRELSRPPLAALSLSVLLSLAALANEMLSLRIWRRRRVSFLAAAPASAEPVAGLSRMWRVEYASPLRSMN